MNFVEATRADSARKDWKVWRRRGYGCRIFDLALFKEIVIARFMRATQFGGEKNGLPGQAGQ